ncbi:MAG: hypothetical protein COA42_23300 [Alteromonadaceae bacterium]|nr:MAG: hypothetical protein COA42_23300 [Alteromonadaceae bacterium]
MMNTETKNSQKDTFQASIHCQLRLLSALPGRERWESIEIKSQDIVCTYISTYLQSEQGIQQVTVNPRTGRILLIFDQKVWPNGAKQAVDAVLQKVVSRVRNFSFSYFQDIQAEQHAIPAQEQTSQGEAKKLAPVSSMLSKVSSLPNFIGEISPAGVSITPLIGYSTFNTVVKLVVPLFAGLTISSAVKGGLPVLAKIGLRSPTVQLVVLASSYFGFTALEGLVERRRIKKWSDYANTVEHGMRTETMDHIRLLDSEQLDGKATSDLFSLVDGDISNIRNFILSVPHSAMDKSLTFSIAATALAFISPLSLLLAAIPLPFIHYFTGKGNEQVQAGYVEKQQAKDKLNRLIIDNLQGLTTIKEYTAEQEESLRLSQASSQHIEVEMQADDQASLAATLIKFSVTFTTVIPIIYSSFMVMKEKLDFSSFSMQTAFLPSIVMATQGLHSDIHLYQSAKMSKARIDALLALQPTIKSGTLDASDSNIVGDIKLNNVSFAYRQKPNVIHDMSLHFPQGKIIGLVGTSGSGKSTIVRLLMRFYDVQEGSITLDDQKLSDFDVKYLRKNIAIVSQDVHLFNGSVTDNIRYGQPDASEEDVFEAAAQAQAQAFIEALPDGFDTQIGNAGATLSGGQRQRLSLARAILKNAPILILDEATSAVDNETESEIQKAINSDVFSDRTIIIIAHRLSTVRQADNIHVISEGQVKESGTHQQLLAHDGHYAKLWGLQVNDSVIA